MTYWPDSTTAEAHYQDLAKVYARLMKEGVTGERLETVKRIMDASDIERHIKSKTPEHFK